MQIFVIHSALSLPQKVYKRKRKSRDCFTFNFLECHWSVDALPLPLLPRLRCWEHWTSDTSFNWQLTHDSKILKIFHDWNSPPSNQHQLDWTNLKSKLNRYGFSLWNDQNMNGNGDPQIAKEEFQESLIQEAGRIKFDEIPLTESLPWNQHQLDYWDGLHAWM